MGANVNIYLSGDARIDNVIDVIGILIGQKKEEKHFNQGDGSYCSVEGVTTIFPKEESKKDYAVYPKPTHSPSMIEIIIPKNKFDKQSHNGSWFYEGDEPGTREIIGGCSEF